MEKRSFVTLTIVALAVLLLIGAGVMRISRDTVPDSNQQLTQQQRLNMLEKLSPRCPSASNVVDTQRETQKALSEVETEGR